MGRKINKGLKKIASALITIVMILALLLVGARLFELEVYAVLSGSMEPAYHTGSVIYVKDVDTLELETGDVITFKLNETTTATHRIIEVISDEENSEEIYFRTKGDANDTADGSLVSSDDVIGTPIFTIPYLGYFAVYIQNPPGIYIAIAVSAALILFEVLIELVTDEKKNASDKETTDGKKKPSEKKQ